MLGRHVGVRPLSTGGRYILSQSKTVQQKRRRGKFLVHLIVFFFQCFAVIQTVILINALPRARVLLFPIPFFHLIVFLEKLPWRYLTRNRFILQDISSGMCIFVVHATKSRKIFRRKIPVGTYIFSLRQKITRNKTYKHACGGLVIV